MSNSENIVVTKIDDNVKRDENAEKKAVEFLLALNSDGGWHACNAVNIGRNQYTVRGGGCHGGLGAVHEPKALVSETTCKPSDYARFNRWWAWMTDREKSPWKALMQHGIELILHPNGNPAGWLLPQQTLEEVPFRFQKNFCIQTRTFQESYSRWILWDTLITKYNMDPTDAYYFISVMGPSQAGLLTYGREPFDPQFVVVANLRTGGHWALTDMEAKDGWEAKINWNVLRSGNIDKGVNQNGKSVYNTQINAYFMYPPPDNSSYNIWTPNVPELLSNNEKGKFSQIKQISVVNAIDAFYKWQDEQGILLK